MSAAASYFIKKKFSILSPRYLISDADRRPLFVAKEAFSILQKRYQFLLPDGRIDFTLTPPKGIVMGVNTVLVVSDASGSVVGKLKQRGLLFAAGWDILDPKDQAVARVEQDAASQVFDRFVATRGLLTQAVPATRRKRVISYNFLRDKENIGSFRQTSFFRAAYELKLSQSSVLEPRMAFASAIAALSW